MMGGKSILGAWLGLVTVLAGQSLEQEFVDPPTHSRAGAFWCWLNGNMTKERITSDLEDMKAKGMSGAEIWDVKAHRDPDGVVPTGSAFMGDESVALIAHAIREGTRLGLRMGMVASSGWNAGGSWVPPKHAGKGLFWSKTDITGPGKIDLPLPFPESKLAPKGADGLPLHSKPVAVLAVPKTSKLSGVAKVIDISRFVDESGRLVWDAPQGEWTALRVICTNHGQSLIVPSPNSEGPMIDFFDPAATEFHVRFIADSILKQLGRQDFRGTAFEYLEFDSMELMSGVLWSDEFAARFEEMRGYSPIAYLPLLCGWSLEDEEANSRFVADYRKSLSDQLILSHYVTGSRVMREYGLELVAEAGGPGPPIWDSCPVDAIKALGAVDVPRGEFWMGNSKNIFLVKEIASASHVYGRKLVDAEAFTTWRRWIDGPVTHKHLADRALCEGLNSFTFHTVASSPPEAGLPGFAYHAGTDINRTATWWPKVKPFMDYLGRTAHMLRQGLFVADVCHFYGEQAPNFYPAKMDVPRKIVPEELGLGYDYDICDAQALITRMNVQDGRIVLPDGMSYAILTLQNQEMMSLEVLRKIEQLVNQGATVVGRKPTRTHGLHEAARHDAELRDLADRLWGACDGKTVTENRYGKGRILWGPSWREALMAQGIGPDFHVVEEASRDDYDSIHRTTDELDFYFVRNRTLEPRSLDCVFRQQADRVELWNPVTGGRSGIDALPVDGGCRLALALPAAGSVFVVFPKQPSGRPALAVQDEPGVLRGISGPWKLRFPEGWGAPSSLEMESLHCWTASENPGVPHFSGTATYEKTITLAKSEAAQAAGLWIDLGDVRDVAEVFFNDQSLGVVWTPPYRVKLGPAAKAGDNRLRVEVTNLWANRMIGDSKLPLDKRFTRSNMSHSFSGEEKLLPSGLLGPVRLLAE